MQTTFFKLCAILLLASLVASGCTSRYRLDLFLVRGAERAKIDVEGSRYTIDSRLGNPFEAPRVVPGNASTVVIETGMRGQKMESPIPLTLGLGTDEYLRYAIYVELPSQPPRPETIGLTENSFVRMLGHYEIPAREKVFLPESGQFVIDSVKSGSLYGTFRNAFWANEDGNRVGFDGRVKFKVGR